MKWNIFVGTLVLGVSLCGQSFGGDLLDRLLGLKGAGCDTSCCDTAPACDPGCGVENACDPGCGVEGPCASACEPACGVESSACGCAAAPTCGVEVCAPKHKPLLSLLHSLKPKKLFKHGCDACDPGCGVEAPCGSCEPACGVETTDCGCTAAAPSCGCEAPCGIKRPRLLDLLFKHHKIGCDTACDAISSCGCGSSAPAAAPAAPAASGETAPVPPAPVVDPSAYLQSKRRVVQASTFAR